MQKVLLIVLLTFGICQSRPGSGHGRILNMITKHGYPAESSFVTTQDGYILELIRISHGSRNKNPETNKPAVLLMHGYMSSAEDFVYGGPSQGLAYYLAEQGYDVYLGSSRGSAYGQNHTTLSPRKDTAFWRYSPHEIGVSDLPAIIDKVRSISRQNKIKFVGHMEGATAFYILASERPEYNQKIEKMVSLGPIAFMKKSVHPILKTIVANYKSKGWILKYLGNSAFKPTTEVIDNVENKCISLDREQRFCENLYFLFNGFNSEHLNQTTVREMLPIVPSGGSVREVLHFAQWMESGRFESLDVNQDQNTEIHEYDLSKVSVPVAIFYTPKDSFSQVEDIQTLIKKLPNIFHEQLFDNLTNNLDLIYANNVVEVYEDLVDVLKQQNTEKNVFA